MHWYHWIASYLIIIGAVVFCIIHEKPWWLWLAIVGCIGVGLSLGVLPSKVDPVLVKANEREAKRRAEQEKSGD